MILSILSAVRILSEQRYASSSEVLFMCQVSSASVSLLISSIFALLVAWPDNDGGLSEPYRRILFGVSVSGAMQSFALTAGPWLVPSYIADSWGRGNDLTCSINGFIFAIGVGSMPMYKCFLSFYYLHNLFQFVSRNCWKYFQYVQYHHYKKCLPFRCCAVWM